MDQNSQSISVLVVEDEPLLLMVAAEILKDAGFTVFEACNARVAKEFLVEHGEVTVLFTDIEMPGAMNGLALAHHARNISAVELIIITSGRRELQSSELPSKAVFLPKPYRLGELIEAVKTRAH